MLLSGCSSLEQSEQQRQRSANLKGEFIYRTSGENHYAIPIPTQRVRAPYPWEDVDRGRCKKITKEHFRCKGDNRHPPHINHKDPARPVNYFDCAGPHQHTLPLREEREYIYPTLIELLNYVQKRTGLPVEITCGHRCPIHDAYADPSSQNSKHMIGAEVDFYVKGMEHQPEKIVRLLMENYKVPFQRLPASTPSTPPWYNEEILIKLYRENEGRDFDNRHPYPYITIQIRYDKDLREKVLCDRQKALKSYRRTAPKQ